MIVRRNNSILFFFLVLLSVSSVSGFICRVGDVNINQTYINNTYDNITPIHLTGTTFSLGTCADNQIYKMNGAVWNCEADDAGAGSYTWNLTADSGTAQVIDTTNTVDIAGGTNGIDTVVGATDKVTINLDWSEVGNDAIAEAKISFSTACGAGNHYYRNGNDLACEADDDTTYSNLSEFTDDLGDRGYTHLGNFTDNLGDRGYTHLGNFTDNLGARGYTHLSNFTDNIGVSSDWDAIGDVPVANITNGDNTHLALVDDIYDWVIGLAYATTTYVDNLISSIGNWTQDKSNYYNSSEVYNKTEIDTQGEMEAIWSVTLSTDSERTTGLSAQDECSEITNCVPSAWDSASDVGANVLNGTHILESDLAVDAVSMEGTDWGTMTDAKWCVYDAAGTEVDCNVEPVVNTDTQDLSYDAGTDVISLVEGGSIDITEVDTDTTYSNTTPIGLTGTTFFFQTCADNQIWKMNGAAWNCEADDAGAGSYTWNLTADSGTAQVIDTTNIVDIAGGTNGIDTVVSATDKVTINLDWSEVANDTIAEAKISFNTACGAGNHYYRNGNDLACEVDDDTTYSAGNGISVAAEVFTVAGNTALSQDVDGLSITADGIGDTQLTYNTGQHLTPTSNATFDQVNATRFCFNANCSHYMNATCHVWSNGATECEV